MVLKMIFLADEAITAGDRLEGRLQMVATKSIPASKIEIFFEGEEYASVNTRDESALSRHPRGKQFNEHYTILKRDIISSRINSIIRRQRLFPEGSYETKFSVETPEDIPSSATFSHGKCVAKIEYNLRVILRGPKDQILHQCNKVINVQAHHHAEELQARRPRLRCHDIRSLLRKGHIFTGAQSRHKDIQPGQKLKIDLAVLNKSRHSVQKVKVVLRERVHWSAKRHRRTLQSNLATLSVCTNALTKAAAPGSLLDRIQDSYWHERNLDKVAAQLRTGENLLSFTLPPVPQDANDTYVGTRLTVTHEVIITLESKKWKRPPEVRIPVRVVSPPASQNTTTNTTSSSSSSSTPQETNRHSDEEATPLHTQPLSIIVESSDDASSRRSNTSLLSGSLELDSGSTTIESTDSWRPEDAEAENRPPPIEVFHSGIEMKPLTQTWLSFSE